MNINEAPLPKGWAFATLESLAGADGIFVDGDWVESKDQDPEGEVRLIQLADIGDGIFRNRSDRFLTSTKAHQLRCTFLQKNDLLIARMPEPLGRSCLFPIAQERRNVTVVDVCVLRIGCIDIDPKYIMFAINSSATRNKISSFQSGSTRKRISRGNLARIEIPIPPALEQLRIVAKIEELFSEIDKGIESLTTAREQLKAYRQSILNEAIIGQIAGFRHFPRKPLYSVIRDIGQGWSPRCLNHPASNDETWAVITTTAVQHGAFLENENKELPKELEPRPHLAIKVGDILVTRAGPRKRVGVACLVRSCRARLMLCDKAYRLRADTAQILPEWLELVLNSPSILQEIEGIKTGISDSGVNLTQTRFLALKVPTPSLSEQSAVLKISDSLTSQIGNLESQIEESLFKAEALRQSILKRAFSGQLVPQDTNDEPASVLLDRIRTEKRSSPRRNRREAHV